MMYKSVLNLVLFHTKLGKCPHCHYRQVYSSLSFVVPVILFTLVYNIPKFFELSTEVKKLKTNNNTELESCMRDALFKTNSFFEVSQDETISNILPDIPAIGSMVSKSYFSHEEVFLVAEGLSTNILQNCCNCSDRIFLKGTDGLECSIEEILTFISRLTTYLSNFNGTKEPNIPLWVLNVR